MPFDIATEEMPEFNLGPERSRILLKMFYEEAFGHRKAKALAVSPGEGMTHIVDLAATAGAMVLHIADKCKEMSGT